MSLLEERSYYKPFKYPFCYEAFKLQNQIHWLGEEIQLAEDVKDWQHNLSGEEKNLLTQIFRFFVQADVDIAAGYYNHFIPVFKQPEVRMMLGAFAAMEGIHIDAYSLLLDTVGMPEAEYKAFAAYEEMAKKHEYFSQTEKHFADWETLSHDPYSYMAALQEDRIKNIARKLAVFSAFGEGIQLFSSFVILLNFSRFNKMKGMSQIVTFSIRDESHHVESMIKLFKQFIKENKGIWTDEFKAEIYQACRDMVSLEDAFIDLAFEQGGIEGLNPGEVKEYIRFIADRRLLQLGLKTNFKVKKNSLPWVDWMLNAPEHSNFFETRATEYSKGMVTGWNEVFP